jgi:hypothetical protein
MRLCRVQTYAAWQLESRLFHVMADDPLIADAA